MERLIDLLSIEGIGETKVYYLLKRFGSAENVFKASLADLEETMGMNKELAFKIKNYKRTQAVKNKIKKLKNLNIKIVTFLDDNYPSLLKNISPMPPVLFYRGNLKKEEPLPIAIIGTRNATSYGKYVAERLAEELAENGVTIVSGLARGIDTKAHKGALKKGKTIAVLGCGVDVYYPPENKKLQDEIAEKGVVLSEFNIGTKPIAQNFPLRNRIISGLSLGVVAVEAGEKSGVLNTVSWAAEQGREVFAVPGPIYAKTSSGTNRLIKEGAKIVTCAEDILEEFNVKEKVKRPEISLSENEKRIMEVLSSEPLYVDEIVEKTGFDITKVLEIMFSLEIKGAVRQLPGKKYIAETK